MTSPKWEQLVRPPLLALRSRGMPVPVDNEPRSHPLDPASRLQAAAGTAERARTRLRELAERARAGVRELADGFRRSDRFFKMRVGIVGAWALLSMATLWGACGSFGPSNALGADVQVNRDSIMGVQLLVRNESTRIWEDVSLTLDDGWKYSQKTMRPHDLVVLSMSSFKKGEEAPPRDYKPRALVIACGRGSERFDLR